MKGTREVGRQFIELASVDSTNKYAAARLAEGGLRHGAVILAHAQMAGVGQRGRVWSMAAGLDIALSVVLLPGSLQVSAHFRVAKVAALAVYDVVAEALGTNATVRIKWPNDVLIDRRKVAGILISNEVSGSQVQSCVVGIGVNVNSTYLDEAFAATSLHNALGHTVDRMALVERLCQRIEARWEQLSTDPGALDAEYADRLWMRGRFADLELDGAPFQARPVDVEPDGRLMVEGPDGTVRAYGLDRLRFAPR